VPSSTASTAICVGLRAARSDVGVKAALTTTGSGVWQAAPMNANRESAATRRAHDQPPNDDCKTMTVSSRQTTRRG
jgi:hypothetical protein